MSEPTPCAMPPDRHGIHRDQGSQVSECGRREVEVAAPLRGTKNHEPVDRVELRDHVAGKGERPPRVDAVFRLLVIPRSFMDPSLRNTTIALPRFHMGEHLEGRDPV